MSNVTLYKTSRDERLECFPNQLQHRVSQVGSFPTTLKNGDLFELSSGIDKLRQNVRVDEILIVICGVERQREGMKVGEEVSLSGECEAVKRI